MFTERQLHIIACLSSAGGWMKGSTLAAVIGTSNKTLQMDIKEINEQVSGKTQILSNNRLGYLLEDADCVFEVITSEKNKKEINPQGTYGRSKQIIMLLLFENDYISIGTIADRLYLSKSTISANLAQVRRIITRTPGAYLKESSNRGFRIVAAENVKRIMFMKTLEKKVDYSRILKIEEFDRIYLLEENLHSLLAEIFTRHQLIITGEAFKDFMKYLAIGIFRSQLGFHEEMQENIVEGQELVEDIVESVEREIGYVFTNEEIGLMEARIKELNLIEKHPAGGADMLKCLENFEREVWEQTGCKLELDPELRNTMAEHMVRMKQRIINGRTNVGNYTKELSFRYPLELHLLKTCLCPALDFHIPDAEVGYMILYLAAVVDKRRQKLKLLLVSDSSAGSIFNLERAMKMYFMEQVNEIKSVPVYLFEQRREEYLDNYQIYITTESELALQYKQVHLINEFVIPSQMEQLRQSVSDVEKARYKKRTESLYDKYISSAPGGQDENREKEFENLLSDLKTGRIKTGVSVECIGSNILCIISHSFSSKNSMIKFPTWSPVTYNGKQITDVIIAHYGGEGDMIEFFDFLREILLSFLK